MIGKLKLVEITESTPWVQLRCDRGEEPSVNVEILADETGMNRVFVPAPEDTSSRLRDVAERLQNAAIAVATEKALRGVVPSWIEVRLNDTILKVGCWHTGSQGDYYKEWGPVTTARIAEVAGVA